MPDFDNGGLSADEFVKQITPHLRDVDKKDLAAKAFKFLQDSVWNSLRALSEVMNAEALPTERPKEFTEEVVRYASRWASKMDYIPPPKGMQFKVGDKIWVLS